MLIRNDKEYRNIQQQVAQNTTDIVELKEGGIVVDAYTKAESDAKYQTKTEMSGYYTKTAADDKFQTQSDMSTYATKTELNAKQNTLVSGTNIKTINGNSILGSGDIVIGEGGTTVTGGTGINVSSEGEISIDTSVVAEVSDIPTKTSQLTNDSGFITGIDSTDITTALGYTPGTSNFSGDYDDLTDKPTIPATVSGTNDGTNWTSLTIGSDTYGLASGGSGGSHLYEHYLVIISNNSSGGDSFDIYLKFISTSNTTITSLSDLYTTLRSTPRTANEDMISCSGHIKLSGSSDYLQIEALGLSGTTDPIYYQIRAFYMVNGSSMKGTKNLMIGSTTYGGIYYDNIRTVY